MSVDWVVLATFALVVGAVLHALRVERDLDDRCPGPAGTDPARDDANASRRADP